MREASQRADRGHPPEAAGDVRDRDAPLEENFRLFVENVQDYAIFMLDPEGRVMTWNAGAANLKGYSAAEIVGQHFSRFYLPEDAAVGRPDEHLSRVRELGRVEMEGWRVRRDGSRFWANVVITAIRDEAGGLRGFGKLTRDLTARLEAERTARALAEMEVARASAEAAEARVRVQQERYQALSRRLQVILEGVADGIVVQDRRGYTTYANPAAARMCGCESPEELIRLRPGEILERFELFDEHGDAVPPEKIPGRQVIGGAEAAGCTLQVRERASGRTWWSAVRARAVTGELGDDGLVVTVWHDITEEHRRRQHARYLAEATELLSSSLDFHSTLTTLANLLVPELSDWCAIHLVRNGVLENVTISHVDPEKVAVAQALEHRYPPSNDPNGGLRMVLESGTAQLYGELSDDLLRAGAMDETHYQGLRELGMKSVILAPIRVGEQVSGTLSVIRSSSGRRFDEADVTLVEELGRKAGAFLENARLYAAEKQARSQLELVVRAGALLAEAVGYEEMLRTVVQMVLPSLADFAFFDVIEGERVRRVAAAHGSPELDDLLQQSGWVGSERRDEKLCALSSGEVGFHPFIDDAWMQDVATSPEHLALLRRLALTSVVTVPLHRKGEVMGALTICYGPSGRRHTPEDVELTQELARRAGIAVLQARLYEQAQLEAQRAEEASRVKDEFLGTVSHELRTPLNAIVGWSSLLLEKVTDPFLRKGLEAIHRNGQAQCKIIEDILDVSRIISGKLRLDAQPVDLVAVVRDGMEVVRSSASAKQIAMRCESNGPCWVVGDGQRLAQVVWNLLSNAVKFTDAEGEVTVTVSGTSDAVALRVRDTGRGIARDFLPHVFERFKQADSSTTRGAGGLGLGLAIVRHIVELHGGEVRAESEGPGRGATFTVELPVSFASSATSLPEGSSHQAAASRVSVPAGLRVLVVDDEHDALELARTVLEQAGAAVEVAASAAEADQKLRAYRPQVLICDIGMPVEDGYTFLRRLRRSDEHRDLPAVALTAYTRGEEQRRALEAGFSRHLSKPFSPEDLVTTIASLVSTRVSNDS